MKPLHGEIKRLSRCPCCVSRYSKKRAGRKSNYGKSAARVATKRALKKEITHVA